MVCGRGGTGRRARLRGVWATVWVQVPSAAPKIQVYDLDFSFISSEYITLFTLKSQHHFEPERASFFHGHIMDDDALRANDIMTFTINVMMFRIDDDFN